MDRMLRFFFIILLLPMVGFSILIWAVDYIWNGKESCLEPFDVVDTIFDHLGKKWF